MLITGASGGIGLELAKLAAANGFSLILAARNRAKLEAISANLTEQFGITAEIVQADLSKPEEISRMAARKRNPRYTPRQQCRIRAVRRVFGNQS